MRAVIQLTTLLYSGSVQAEDCSILERLRSSSQLGFEDIRGKENELGDFDTTFVMEGADCQLRSMGTDSPSYLCIWNASKDEAAARAAFNEFFASTKNCSSSATPVDRWQDDESESAILEDGEGFVDLKVIRYKKLWSIYFEYQLHRKKEPNP